MNVVLLAHDKVKGNKNSMGDENVAYHKNRVTRTGLLKKSWGKLAFSRSHSEKGINNMTL